MGLEQRDCIESSRSLSQQAMLQQAIIRKQFIGMLEMGLFTFTNLRGRLQLVCKLWLSGKKSGREIFAMFVATLEPWHRIMVYTNISLIQ